MTFDKGSIATLQNNLWLLLISWQYYLILELLSKSGFPVCLINYENLSLPYFDSEMKNCFCDFQNIHQKISFNMYQEFSRFWFLHGFVIRICLYLN